MGGKLKIKIRNRKNKTKCGEKGKNRRAEPIKLGKKSTSRSALIINPLARGLFLRLQKIVEYVFLKNGRRPPASFGGAGIYLSPFFTMRRRRGTLSVFTTGIMQAR